MSDDIADHYAALKERSRHKRQSNRDHAPIVLQREGISYISHNGARIWLLNIALIIGQGPAYSWTE